MGLLPFTTLSAVLPPGPAPTSPLSLPGLDQAEWKQHLDTATDVPMIEAWVQSGGCYYSFPCRGRGKLLLAHWV